MIAFHSFDQKVELAFLNVFSINRVRGFQALESFLIGSDRSQLVLIVTQFSQPLAIGPNRPGKRRLFPAITKQKKK
jgi:hypothetical protein